MTDGPVRRISRLRLHLGVTAGTILALVLGEVAGNLLFRGGTIRITDLGDEVALGVLLGNLIALWLWYSTAKR